MISVKKGKNVLITSVAYEMLINEYHLKPSQLLAKMPTLEDRVKSPKTNRFIHIGSNSYMKLISDGYTEDQLLLRRDGFIVSPETSKLVKVFSKTFNMLLTQYELDDLLKLPRVKRGDNKVGVDFNITNTANNDNKNNITNNEEKEIKEIKIKKNKEEKEIKIKKNKEEKKEKKEENEIIIIDNVIIPQVKKPLLLTKIVNKKSIDDLILNSITPLIVFTSGDFYQTNEEFKRNDDEPFKDCHAFHCAAGVYKKGELTSYYEAKEYRMDDDSLTYNYYIQGELENKVKNMDDYLEFLYINNERSLINIVIVEIDLLSLYQLLNKKYNHVKAKNEIVNILNLKLKEFQNQTELFKIVKLHTWFISNAQLMQVNVKFTKIIDSLIGPNDETDYENLNHIVKSKQRLSFEINYYYKEINNYIQKHL